MFDFIFVLHCKDTTKSNTRQTFFDKKLYLRVLFNVSKHKNKRLLLFYVLFIVLLLLYIVCYLLYYIPYYI